MDGGIIEGAILESMMTGAAVGGGSSLLQGKDPLQGALLGGLMGGAGGAMFGGAPTGAMPGATPAAATTAASTAPAAPAGIESVFAPTATQYGAFGEAPLGQSFDAFGSPVAAGSPAATMADPTGLAQQQMALNAAKPQSQGIMSGAKDWWGGLSDKQKLLAGGAGIAGLGMISDQMRGGVPKKKPYSGALSRFSYNPDTYVPWARGFAAGGVTGGSAGDGLGEINNGVSMIADALNTAQNALGGAPGASGGFAGSYPTIPAYGSGNVDPNTNNGTYGQPLPILDKAPSYLGGLDDSHMGDSMFQRNNNPTGPQTVNMSDLAGRLGINANFPSIPQTVGQTGPQSANVSMFAAGGATGGGIASLGGYSDGGRMLKGPGDGMSDSIPARIGNKQPARLADGEFVVPADVVSHLGNGSTDAGAKQLYAMMDKVRKARTGNPKQGKQINARKYLPA